MEQHGPEWHCLVGEVAAFTVHVRYVSAVPVRSYESALQESQPEILRSLRKYPAWVAIATLISCVGSAVGSGITQASQAEHDFRLRMSGPVLCCVVVYGALLRSVAAGFSWHGATLRSVAAGFSRHGCCSSSYRRRLWSRLCGVQRLARAGRYRGPRA